MSHEEATRLLTSASPHERLRAARYFARNTMASDLEALRQARSVEVVSYVKQALDRAISRNAHLGLAAEADPADEQLVPAEIRKQIWNRAVEWVTGLVLHEIASPMGLVKLSASREIQNYDTSKTRHHLEGVARIFDAIEQLKNAASVPRLEQFDLAELLGDIVSAESLRTPVPISLYGQRPLLITSDRALLRLAICNGLRNAIEATGAVGSEGSNSVVVTWGETDVDYWVSILDKGRGIIGPAASAFEIGKTTKKGHSGFGLAIAKQAMETLGGSVSLQPAADGGARFEVRWEL